MTESINLGIDLVIPTAGEKNWDADQKVAMQAISSHAHLGSGDGNKISPAGFNWNADLLPATTNLYDLGSASKQAGEVWAQQFKTTGGNQSIGTFSLHDVDFYSNSTLRWQISSTGDLLPATDDTYNIGSASFAVGAIIANNITSNKAMELGSFALANLNFYSDSTLRWSIGGNGDFTPWLTNTYDIGNSTHQAAEVWARQIKASGGALAIGTFSNHNLGCYANSTLIWNFLPGGDFSGDTTNGGDVVFNKALTGPREASAQTASIAGSSQGTATAITSNVVHLVGGSTGGVRLPVPNGIGHEITIFNETGLSAKIYPATGGTIQTLGTNTAVTLIPGLAIKLKAYSATEWAYVGSLIVA